jgi:hypothetical protein
MAHIAHTVDPPLAEKYCRCSQVLADPTGSRWRPCPDVVGNAVLDALG